MEDNISTLERYVTMLGDLVVQFGTKLIAAVIVLVIGLWIIKRILNVFNSLPEWGDRIQYDTPTFWGTKLAASHTYRGRHDVWDIAVKHASEIGVAKIAAQAGYFSNNSNIFSLKY